MITFKKAAEKDSGSLIKIWHICFDDDVSIIQDFLSRGFDSFVAEIEGKAVAALHLINTQMAYNGNTIDGVYLYAAATLPKYRGIGIMGGLIDYANQEAKREGASFCALMPADPSLFNYYRKFGYFDFFKSVNVTKSAKQLDEICKNVINNTKDLFDNIADLRFNIYNKNNGNILCSAEQIDYAVKMYKHYGGCLITASGGYMICSRVDETQVQIIECACTHKSLPQLISKLRKKLDAQSYVFRLPANRLFFNGDGDIYYSGMLKPLRDEDIFISIINANPYIGLTLD